MNPTLDYQTPAVSPRRLSVRTAAVSGIVAGAITFGSFFVLGPILSLGVGILAGVVVSALAARASPGFEFRAGFLASGFAAASAFFSSMLGALGSGGGIGRAEPTEMVLVLGFWWALFAVPGMLGSLWFWEGRRQRTWDDANV